MRHNVMLAVFMAWGIALFGGVAGTVHAEGLLDKLKKLQDAANATKGSAGPGSSGIPGKAQAAQANSATTHASGGPARDIDIVGLRIGMSVDEAMKVLKSRHSQGRQSRLEDTFEGIPPSRVLYGLHSENATPGKTTETIRVAVAGAVSAPTVVGVTRTELFHPGKETDRQNLLQALIGKYGKPDHTEQRPHADSLTWFLDKGSTKPYCRNAFAQMFNKTNIMRNPGNYPECGRVLQAGTSGSGQNQNLIGRLEIAVYDHRLAYDGINMARKQVAASADRLRAEESKRAKSNKPSL